MNGQKNNLASMIKRGLIVIVIGLVIWYSPVPTGIKPEAWHLLAIFVATIFGLILAPLPMGAVVIIGLTMTTLKRAYSKSDRPFRGLPTPRCGSSRPPSCSPGRSSCTGMGRRISYLFIRLSGKDPGARRCGLGSELGPFARASPPTPRCGRIFSTE